jgi:hypothetical protein
MSHISQFTDLVKKIPEQPYGSFTEDETSTLKTASWLICGPDVEKQLLLLAIIDAHVKRASLEEAFNNAGPSQ